MSHATRILDLSVLLDELLEHMDHAEDTTWVPSVEALAAVSARLGRPDAAPTRLPSAGPRKRRVRAPGLLAQLGDLDGHAWAVAGDTSTRATPESRVPPGGHAVDALAALHGEVQALWAHVGGTGRPSTAGALRGILGRAPDLDDTELEGVYRAVAGWARALRVELGWEVRVVSLPDVYCPECEQPGTLRVRADASSDVWCSGHLIGPARHGEPWPRPCGERWPRHRWIALLDALIARGQEAS